MRSLAKFEISLFLISVLLGLASVVNMAHVVYNPVKEVVVESQIYCTLAGAKLNRHIRRDTPESEFNEGCWRVSKEIANANKRVTDTIIEGVQQWMLSVLGY